VESPDLALGSKIVLNLLCGAPTSARPSLQRWLPKAQSLHREARAFELLMAGRDYDQIAAELGYSNRSGAWHTVQRALRKRREEIAGEYLTLELDHLDALQCALWDAAMNGDPKAVDAILKISTGAANCSDWSTRKGAGGQPDGQPRRAARS